MQKTKTLLGLLCIILILGKLNAQTTDLDKIIIVSNDSTKVQLTAAGAEHFAQLVLNCATKEYPNKTSHTMEDDSRDISPKELHPAFYGCFDWHSCVHGHWMLVKLLKQFPNMASATKIKELLASDLNKNKIVVEAQYYDKYKIAKSYERPYGWGWILKLDQELVDWKSNPDAQVWHENLQPLVEKVKQLWSAFLPDQVYPDRSGMHSNTAFAMVLALDYARTVKDTAFENLLVKRAKDYYLNDKNIPANWEPNATDFLSPSLEEADLMRRILSKNDFQNWLNSFYNAAGWQRILQLPTIKNRSDYMLVHMDGLNLSRAWCLYGLAKQSNDPKNAMKLKKAAIKDLLTTLPYIASGNYGGEHWLGTFAVYALNIINE
ncbi:DUF2891 domain-containing protein [Rhizosphaericola mali]|uniref:DUF2891 domain-containing protein n=1 Tax=Rhizosphaericola mali TaxID=2545455 RepID=A0A5P2G8U0_9BACT|nr:DUF2891 domain-containing protein [Rhizosphaericola mali]QES90719.1 DUF2891 domain-containing protein [Rhizosphaericola mali]